MTRVTGDYDRRGRARVQTVNDEDSLTVQSDSVKADIHEILRPYGPLGMDQILNDADAMFMDVSEFTDYADMMRQTADAEFEFMKLPPKIRRAFDNDVYKWLDAAHDPEKRRNVLEKLGLVDSKTRGESGGAPDPASVPSGDAPAPASE